jgi:hypothetical protein
MPGKVTSVSHISEQRAVSWIAYPGKELINLRKHMHMKRSSMRHEIPPQFFGI